MRMRDHPIAAMNTSEICGSCTMCCKSLSIINSMFRGEPFGKPPGEWCPHCAIGKGCKVYEERPKTCSDYTCAYLQAVVVGEMPDPDLRPDRCGVLITGTGDERVLSALVDRHKPDAWRRGKIFRFLLINVAAGAVFLIGTRDPDRKLVMHKRGGDIVLTEQEFTPADEDGRRWVEKGTGRFIEKLCGRASGFGRSPYTPLSQIVASPDAP